MSSLQNQPPLSVLIADDCAVTRRLLTLFLKKQGYQVAITENGEECLNAALKDSYDLVISDLDMPKMSGIECARAIRHAGRDLPIIAITAAFPEIIRDECLQAGMNAFMTKPLNFPELKNKINELSVERKQPHPTR